MGKSKSFNMDSSDSSRSSSQNLSPIVHLTFAQKLDFVNMLEPDKELLFGNLTKEITALARASRWKEIFNQLKANEVGLKTVKHLKSVVWGNIRKDAKKKFENNRQTGATLMPYTEVDRVTLNIMNTKSASLVGLGAPDRVPTFSNQIGNSTESVHDLTTESSFNLNLGAGTSTSSFPFVIPQAPGPTRRGPRASSPLLEDSELEEEDLEQSGHPPQTGLRTTTGQTSKKRKGPTTNILFDPAYKSLKFENMILDREEQQLRMELIRAKIKAENRRAEYFEKACLKLEHQDVLIQVPIEEEYVMDNH